MIAQELHEDVISMTKVRLIIFSHTDLSEYENVTSYMNSENNFIAVIEAY